MRYCKKCNTTKQLKDFESPRSNFCIECKLKIRKETLIKNCEWQKNKYYQNHEENKRKLREKNAPIVAAKQKQREEEKQKKIDKILSDGFKICNGCKKETLLSDMSIRKERLLGIGNYCKKCETEKERKRFLDIERKKAKDEYRKKHWKENKEIITDKKRKYREENYEHAKELRLNSYARERGFKNYNDLLIDREKRKQLEKQNRATLKRLTKQELINYNNQYKDIIEASAAFKILKREEKRKKDLVELKKRRLSDPQYRLTDNYRALTRKAYRNQGTSKSSKSFQLLGITGLEFHHYFNSMNYNPEKDTIDHIVPISKFDLTNKCHEMVANHYLNLRPLDAGKNYSKSDSLIDGWQDKIIEICNVRNIDPLPIIKHVQESKKC